MRAGKIFLFLASNGTSQDDMRYVAEISDLSSLPAIRNEEVVYVRDKYRGGHFYYDNSDTTTEDDGGTVFVFDSKRWKRIIDANEGFNIAWWAGEPWSLVGSPPDHTAAIRNCIYAAMRYNVATGQRLKIVFPPGLYLISETIDWTTDPLSALTTHSGWTIEGVQTSSLIGIKPGVTISGTMFNFNKNSSSLSRYNILRDLYWFNDGVIFGRCDSVCDFSYNNRWGMYNCRTSRISNVVDIAVHFSYEFTMLQCNLTGSRTLGIASDGIHLSDEANAGEIIGCSIDNYIGNELDITDPEYIPGAAIRFEGSKGVTIETLTAQQCYYGVLLGSQAKDASITGGGYFEKNRLADIGFGDGGAGAVYNTRIEGGAIKSAGFEGIDTNGIRINGISVHKLTVEDATLDNADALMLVPRTNQVITDVTFKNCNLGDTVYGYRNLVQPSASMYMDNIKVTEDSSLLGASATYVPILSDQYKEYAPDFDDWTKLDGSPLDNPLVQNGTFMGAPVWEKQNGDIESISFLLNDVSGLQNQILTFSCWISFNGSINANDGLFANNQADTRISFSRPLNPQGLSTTDRFVKIHLYIKVGAEFVEDWDTQVKVVLFTRTNGLKIAKPSLKLGFV